MAPRIETARIILRGWNDDDIEAWARMNADPRVMEFFQRTNTREESVAMAHAMSARLEQDGFGWFVTEVKGEMPFAGVTALAQIPFEAHFTPAKEVGWRFLYDAWGHGYATEAAAAAMDFAFLQLGWKEIIAITAVINARSRKVMERLGMTHDPKDDFDHPRIEEGHHLRRHVLYRKKAPTELTNS